MKIKYIEFFISIEQTNGAELTSSVKL